MEKEKLTAADKFYLKTLHKAKATRDLKLSGVALLFLGISIVFYYVFPTAPTLTIPNIKFTNVSITTNPQNLTASRIDIFLNFTLDIYNPTLYKVDVKELYAKILYRSVFYVGSISESNMIIFPSGKWNITYTSAHFVITEEAPEMAELIGEDLIRGYFTLQFQGFARISVLHLPAIKIPFYIKQDISPIPMIVKDSG